MDSKMQKVANIIGYLIGGILVSLAGIAAIVIFWQIDIVDFGVVRMTGLASFTIPNIVWIGGTIEDPND